MNDLEIYDSLYSYLGQQCAPPPPRRFTLSGEEKIIDEFDTVRRTLKLLGLWRRGKCSAGRYRKMWREARQAALTAESPL